MKIEAGLGVTIDGLKLMKGRIERMRMPGWDTEQEIIGDAIAVLEALKEEQDAKLAEIGDMEAYLNRREAEED